jgi:pimeloyl-ACP methyl ester carboxylesterase
MPTVTSKDGTKIAYDRVGAGRPLILVDGAWGHRSFGPNVKLPPLLADRFSVIHFDRRGRGGSDDTPPWTVEREIEDLEAIIDVAGGTADVYGISAGGALTLAAAERLPGIKRVAVYEVPFVVDSSRPPMPADFAWNLRRLAADGRRGDAVKYFMREGARMPPAIVALMRFSPAWSKLRSVAHTTPYDAALIGDLGEGRPLPRDRWRAVTQPALVAAGGNSPPWLRKAMDGLADVLPNAEHRVLDGQSHFVKPKAIAPALAAFFGR